jgi:hypothetical protein
MKKVLVLLLLIVSTSVFAEWANVDDNDEMTTYVDFGTIKKKGNKVKIWSLIDFKTVQTYEKIKFLSQLTRNEYDCEEETRRMLDLFWYSVNMRQGEIVFSSKNIKDEAESIVPGSIDETLFKIACSNK